MFRRRILWRNEYIQRQAGIRPGALQAALRRDRQCHRTCAGRHTGAAIRCALACAAVRYAAPATRSAPAIESDHAGRR